VDKVLPKQWRSKCEHVFSIIEHTLKNDSIYIFYWFLATLIFLTIFMYFDYLTGTKYYIFNDIGSDSYTQIYPQLSYLADRVTLGSFGQIWNSYNSIGNPESYALPLLWNMSAFFGRENIAYLMGIMQVVRIFLAGTLFYNYLRVAGRTRFTSAIFGLIYAYCGHMIVRGCWMSYPNEVVFLALWLLSFELFFKKNTWWLLPISTALFYINFSGYYIIFYTALFFGYAVFREYVENSDRLFSHERLRKLAKFSLLILIGLLGSSIVSFESISIMLSSQRFANGKSNFWNDLNLQLIFSDPDTIKSIFYSFFGTDILGINDYTGPHNILGGPALYCGLLTILLIPYTIHQVQGKKRFWYISVMLVIALYLFIRPIRLLANALSSTQFKLSSFWIIVILIFIASEGLELLKGNHKSFNKKILAVEFLIILLLSYLLRDIGINSNIMFVSLIFLSFYGILLLCYACKKKILALIILAFAIPCEIAFEDYRLINDRGTVNQDIIKSKQGFNDYTNDALASLNEDKSAFYRIDKQYESVSFTDSLYQKYYGTKAYIGATGDLQSTGEFYDSLNFAISGGNNHVMLGFSQSSVINSVMNVKYILSKSPIIGNYGYSFVNKCNDVYIFRNNYSLPLGYEYKEYMSRDDFEKLSIIDKRYALSKYAIIEKDYIHSLHQLPRTQSYKFMEKAYNQINKYKVESSYLLNNSSLEIEFPPVKEGNMALLVLDIDVNNSNSTTYVYSTEDTSNHAWYDFKKEVHQYIYELNDKGTKKVSFTLNSPMKVNDISVFEIPKTLYYQEYMNNLKKLQETNSNIKTMNGEYFYGTYKALDDAILTFSIPYSDKWKLYMNGQEKELMPINISSMGCFITKGEYDVELIYQGNTTFLWISILTTVAYICMLVYVVKRQRRNI